MATEKIKKISAESWIIIWISGIFIYNGYSFLNTEGNTNPLVGALFNMIIVLSILFYLFHKEDLKDKKDEVLSKTKLVYQECLDKYFKILKK